MPCFGFDVRLFSSSGPASKKLEGHKELGGGTGRSADLN